MWEKKMTAAVCIAMVTGGTACLDLRPSTESTKRAKSLKREHSDSVFSLSHTHTHTKNFIFDIKEKPKLFSGLENIKQPSQ